MTGAKYIFTSTWLINAQNSFIPKFQLGFGDRNFGKIQNVGYLELSEGEI